MGIQNERTMKNATIFLLPVLLIVLLGTATKTMGQVNAQPGTKLVVQVEGLTSAVRDGLMHDLRNTADLRLAYACVPAGILVFEAPPALSRTAMEQRARTLLTDRNSALHPRITEQSQAEAEALCAQARNR